MIAPGSSHRSVQSKRRLNLVCQRCRDLRGILLASILLKKRKLFLQGGLGSLLFTSCSFHIKIDQRLFPLLQPVKRPSCMIHITSSVDQDVKITHSPSSLTPRYLTKMKYLSRYPQPSCTPICLHLSTVLLHDILPCLSRSSRIV